MKLSRLELLAYGSFTDAKLDFAGTDAALQLIYGANEAGKSTTLRAIHTLFYGIPENTPDAYLHRPDKLRIGALLRDATGRELHVVRRKGRKNTLLGADGEPLTASDEAWISAGIVEPQFEALFGLSYATLAQKAEEMLAGGGANLGESLFGAGVGGRAVHEILSALSSEADQIWRPRGSTQKLSVALRELEEQKRKIREEAKHAEEFTKLERAIEQAETEDASVRNERVQLLVERSALERAKGVLPILGKLAELQRLRAELGEVLLLPADAPDQRRAAEEALRGEARRIADTQLEIESLTQERAALQVPETLLALSPSVIDGLRDRIGGYKRARAELPVARDALSQAERQTARILRSLGREAQAENSTAEASLPVVDTALVRRIRAQASREQGLTSALTQSEKALADKARELTAARAKLAAHNAAIGGQQQQAALPLLALLSLPSAESVSVFEERFAVSDRELRVAQDEQQTHAVDNERLLHALDALTRAAAVPSPAELTAVREQRQLAWSQLTKLLVDEQSAARGFSGKGEGHALVRQTEELIERADKLGDRLRQEASRVEQYLRLLADRASLERRVVLSNEALAKRRSEREQLEREWQALWRDAGLAPRSPREMRAYLLEHRSLQERIEGIEAQLREQEDEQQRQARSAGQWREEWRALMQALELHEDAPASDAEARLEAHAQLAAQAELLQVARGKVAALEQECARFEASVSELVAKHVPEQRELGADVAASTLAARHQDARAAAARRTAIDTELGARHRRVESARAEQAAAQAHLQALLDAAGVSDVVALAACEQRSVHARALDLQAAQALSDLALVSDGKSVELLRNEVEGMKLDEVRARLLELERQLERADERSRETTLALAGSRAQLAQLREGHGAVDAATRAAEQVTSIRALGERYVRLRLASALLEQEVARYRERHKGPVLRTASDYFARLTLGAFSGLEADYTTSDQPVLVCVRANADRVPLAGLSAGTRDQLYLALRLASVRELGQQQELMPLVLDDILVHFDDDRARAALLLLGALAQTTQVLFFTHHTRLRELAREALPAASLVLHSIG